MKNKNHQLVLVGMLLAASLLFNLLRTVDAENNSSKILISHDTEVVFNEEEWEIETVDILLSEYEEFRNNDILEENSGRGSITLTQARDIDDIDKEIQNENFRITIASVYNYNFSDTYGDCSKTKIIHQKEINTGYLNIVSIVDDENVERFYEIRHSTNPSLRVGENMCSDTSENYVTSSYKENQKYLYAVISDYDPANPEVNNSYRLEELEDFLEKNTVKSAIKVLEDVKFSPSKIPGTDISF